MTSGLELHEASSMGDYDALEDYLKSGKYDVNLQDPEWKNKTPLHWAAGRGQILVVTSGIAISTWLSKMFLTKPQNRGLLFYSDGSQDY